MSVVLFLTCSISILPLYGIPDYVRTLHQTTWAHFLHFDKQYEQAKLWYDDIHANSASIYSLKGYIFFLYDRQDYQRIMKYIDTIQTQFSSDLNMQRIAAHTLAECGKTAQADALFIALNKKFPTNPDVALEAIKSLARAGKTQEALDVTHTIINKIPYKQSNFLFFFVQAQLHVALKNNVQARESLQQCLALRPQFAQALLLLTLIDAQEGNVKQSLQGYRSFLNNGGQHNKELEHYLLTLSTQQYADKNRPTGASFGFQALYKKALQLHKEGQFLQALAVSELGIKQAPDNPYLKILKIQILLDMKKSDSALTQILAWMNKDPEQQVWYSLMHLIAYTHMPVAKVIASFEVAPATMWRHLYLADLYTRESLYTKAIECLEQAVVCTTDSKVRLELYFSLALLYYEQNNTDALKRVIEQGLAHKLVYAPFYNLAAYYYATKGKDATAAQRYIEQVLAQEPENIHYLDTQAVIWYKTDVFDKAEELLSTLHLKDPKDTTILLNLAKVKYKVGKKSEAYTLVEKARSAASHSHEHNTIARLEQKWHQVY